MSTESGFSAEEEARILAKRARDSKRAKRLAKRNMDATGAMNINSMMDMMTIILVFLIDSYGNNPIQVTMGPDLVIPQSVSELSPEDTMQITITRKDVIVGDKQVVTIKDGQIDKSKKRGGENSLYIQPLFDELTEEVSRQKQMAALRRKPYEGVVTIVADRTVPYRLLTEVMYTAGQAQLANFKFAIVRFSRGDKAKKAANAKGG